MPKIEHIRETLETDGCFQVNIYEDGTLGIENYNGEETRGTEEDLVFLIRVLMPLLRKPRH
jgi:hypothetical protein